MRSGPRKIIRTFFSLRRTKGSRRKQKTKEQAELATAPRVCIKECAAVVVEVVTYKSSMPRNRFTCHCSFLLIPLCHRSLSLWAVTSKTNLLSYMDVSLCVHCTQFFVRLDYVSNQIL